MVTRQTPRACIVHAAPISRAKRKSRASRAAARTDELARIIEEAEVDILLSLAEAGLIDAIQDGVRSCVHGSSCSDMSREPSKDDIVAAYHCMRLLWLEVESELTARLDGATLPAHAGRTIAKASSRAAEAKSRIIEENLPLVFYWASKSRGRGVPESDLAQEGSIGLMRAVDRFERRRGFRFSTYASWWIRQSIDREITNMSRTVRLPVHQDQKLKMLRRIRQQIEAEAQGEARVEEIAHRAVMPSDRVRQTLVDGLPIASLEAPLGREGTFRLSDTLPATCTEDPLESSMSRELGRKIGRALEALTERESLVLRMRFGLGYCSGHTLEQIGQTIGVTRERIRQIEKQGLDKLRRTGLTKELRAYL